MTGDVHDAPHRMLPGDRVNRVVSKLGCDDLVGYCWCGESRESQDPVELWTWIWAHNGGHDGSPSPAQAPLPQGPHRHQREPVLV